MPSGLQRMNSSGGRLGRPRFSERATGILSDSRALFLRRLTDIARHAGLVSPPVLAAFTQALGEAYDELVIARRDGFERTHGLTASHIRLVADDDLELELRIGEIGRRLADIGGNLLWRVLRRFMTLLGRPEMTPADNPVGTDAIATSLLAVCRASGAGHDEKLVLLANLEEQLALDFCDIYRELDELLAGNDVGTAQAPAATGGGGTRPDAQAPPADAGGPNPLSALQSLLGRQRTADGAEAVAGMPDMRGAAQASPGNIALSVAGLVALNQLAARLDQIGSSAAAVSAGDLGLPPGNPEAVAVDTLSLIFEDISASGDLPDVVATMIARLKIPLLKVAIFDPSLFSDSGHPARRLINGMARAAVGLPRGAGRGHPLCTRLWRLADVVCDTLHRDCSVLSAPLAELGTLIAERDRAVVAESQAYLPLAETWEARGQATAAAHRWLRGIVGEHGAGDSGVAPGILDFLRRYWVRAMAVAAREEGGAGSLWREYHDTVVDLLWSVQPKLQPEERKQLVRLVPSLLKRINAALDRIGVTAEEREPFLDDCFALQTAAVRGAPLPPAATELPADSAPAPGIAVDTLEIDGRRLKVATRGASVAAAGPAPDGAVHAGDWLDFNLGDGEALCGLVCWRNPQSGSVLLFNPDWGYAVAVACGVLEDQLLDARAGVASSRAIFDVAAQRVIDRLSAG
ncbi:MAG: DUF1631 family protein [Betaproteobacteria bacterium]|nr:DUF1631 family protein [Betaproteobacteria bacterium]